MPPWAVLTAVIVAIDVHAGLRGRPTLSEAFRTGHNAQPLLVGAVTGYVLAHLYGALPKRVDVIHIGATRMVTRARVRVPGQIL